MRAAGPLIAAVAVVLLVGAGGPVDGPPTAAPSAAGIAASVSVFSVAGSVDVLASTTRRDGTSALTVGTDVLFAFGGDRLDARAARALERRLEEVPRGASVRVVGHTDSVGSVVANSALSLRRARAVAAAVARARPDVRTSAAGSGEWVPVAPNVDPAGRAENRRVTLSWTG